MIDTKNEFIHNLLKSQKKITSDQKNINDKKKIIDENVNQLQYFKKWLNEQCSINPNRERLAIEGLHFLSAIALACFEENRYFPETFIWFNDDVEYLYIRSKTETRGILINIKISETNDKYTSYCSLVENDKIISEKTSPEQIGGQFIWIFPNESMVDKIQTFGKSFISNLVQKNRIKDK